MAGQYCGHVIYPLQTNSSDYTLLAATLLAMGVSIYLFGTEVDLSVLLKPANHTQALYYRIYLISTHSRIKSCWLYFGVFPI